MRPSFNKSEATATPAPQQALPAGTVKLMPPRLADIPHHDTGKQILFGRRLLAAKTKRVVADNVGDALDCDSCHLNGGSVPLASPYLGMSVNIRATIRAAGQ